MACVYPALNFLWLDGSTVSYTNWAVAPPSCGGFLYAYYVYADTSDDSRWYTASFSGPAYYILCERRKFAADAQYCN